MYYNNNNVLNGTFEMKKKPPLNDFVIFCIKKIMRMRMNNKSIISNAIFHLYQQFFFIISHRNIRKKMFSFNSY